MGVEPRPGHATVVVVVEVPLDRVNVPFGELLQNFRCHVGVAELADVVLPLVLSKLDVVHVIAAVTTAATSSFMLEKGRARLLGERVHIGGSVVRRVGEELVRGLQESQEVSILLAATLLRRHSLPAVGGRRGSIRLACRGRVEDVLDMSRSWSVGDDLLAVRLLGRLALKPLGVRVDILEPVHLLFSQSGHEDLEALQIQRARIVHVPTHHGENFLVRFIELGEGALVDVEMREVRQKIVAHQKAEEDPVVNDVFEVVFERQNTGLLKVAELVIEILSKQGQMEEVERGLLRCDNSLLRGLLATESNFFTQQ